MRRKGNGAPGNPGESSGVRVLRPELLREKVREEARKIFQQE